MLRGRRLLRRRRLQMLCCGFERKPEDTLEGKEEQRLEPSPRLEGQALYPHIEVEAKNSNHEVSAQVPTEPKR